MRPREKCNLLGRDLLKSIREACVPEVDVFAGFIVPSAPESSAVPHPTFVQCALIALSLCGTVCSLIWRTVPNSKFPRQLPY